MFSPFLNEAASGPDAWISGLFVVNQGTSADIVENPGIDVPGRSGSISGAVRIFSFRAFLEMGMEDRQAKTRPAGETGLPMDTMLKISCANSTLATARSGRCLEICFE